MTGRVLIYGGKGGLGSVLVSHFKQKGWWICSVDISEKNDEADANIIVDPNSDWLSQEEIVVNQLEKYLSNEQKLDSVINMAGGWAGGSTASKDFIKNSDLMWKQSVWSSTISAKVANKHLKSGGILVLPGAAPASAGTPGMIGYGMAKAAVHQLTKSLAEPKSGMPENSRVFALLPITLDTPMNRKWMPKADTSKWTPLTFIAELLFSWSSNSEGLPKNGSLVKLVTNDGSTELIME